MGSVRATVAGLVAAAAVGAGAVALGTTADETSGRKDYRPNRQAVAWQRATQTTASTRFVDVPGLSDLFVKHRGPIAVTVSANFKGDEIQLRVAGFKPRAAILQARSVGAEVGYEARSFSFVSKGSREPSCLPVTVQWRSPTGEEVSLDGATAVISYRYVGKEAAARLGCV